MYSTDYTALAKLTANLSALAEKQHSSWLQNTALNYRLRREENTRLTTLAQLSHELKKPFSIIRALLDQAHKADTNRKQINLIAEINTEIDRATNMLDDIITLNQLKLKQVNDPYKLNLSRLCREIYEQRTLIHQRHTWYADIAPDIYLTVAPEHICCILENLLDNATKYTPTNGSITFELKNSNRQIHLIVRDTGIGLTQSEQKHILEPFYRARDANHQASGTGLGLAIVAQAVNNLAGELVIKSKKGKGSTFCILLPLKD